MSNVRRSLIPLPRLRGGLGRGRDLSAVALANAKRAHRDQRRRPADPIVENAWILAEERCAVKQIILNMSLTPHIQNVVLRPETTMVSGLPLWRARRKKVLIWMAGLPVRFTERLIDPALSHAYPLP